MSLVNMSKYKVHICIIYYFFIIVLTYVDATEEVDDSTIFFENQETAESRIVFRNDKIRKFTPVQQLFTTDPIQGNKPNKKTKHIGLKSKDKNNAYLYSFNDPYWPHQWYAHDTRTELGPVMDHNLVPVYQQGITGRDVIVGVIGEGVLRGLDDIKKYKWGDRRAIPRKKILVNEGQLPFKNKLGEVGLEGTKMAGVIAMNANNAICGVGVAFESSVIGIRVDDEQPKLLYNKEIAQAITYSNYEATKKTKDGLCHIYAFALGRPDDGAYMNKEEIIVQAFEKGAMEGREKRGSIYVVGAGNGKKTGEDNCGADDLANDPHTLVIASADRTGKVTPYSERCAAVTATAYSSGDGGNDDEAVVTVGLGDTCSIFYTGNLPSVGIATGIIALALEKNPDLTARDIHHLIAMTSEVAPLADNSGTWIKNYAGFYVSNDFGFGLLNAKNMVNMAKNWVNVPKMMTTEAKFIFDEGTVLEPGKHTKGYVDASSTIQYIENVELIATVRLKYRGSIKLLLTSASATEVVMMEPRPRDRLGSGLDDWIMKTSHFWGEQAKGRWYLTASIEKFTEDPSSGLGGLYNFLSQEVFRISPNEILKIKLVVHGTPMRPKHYPFDSENKRKYSDFVL